MQVRIIEDDIAELVIGLTGEGGLDGITIYEDGGTARINVSLSTQPTNNVVINLSVADTDEATVSPATLTFTPQNWNTPQTVTVTGVDDDIPNIDYTAVITVSVNRESSDLTYADVDDKTVHVLLVNDDNNSAPTNILLNGGDTVVVRDDVPVGGAIASISAVDEDVDDVHTFTLTCSAPGADD